MHDDREDDPDGREIAELVDLQGTGSAIAATLAALPLSEDALRRDVWTYVDAARDAGTPPGDVIVALTTLVEEAAITPPSARQALMRDVILWSVEAYFSRIGGGDDRHLHAQREEVLAWRISP